MWHFAVRALADLEKTALKMADKPSVKIEKGFASLRRIKRA
jgi:hypothetical protein